MSNTMILNQSSNGKIHLPDPEVLEKPVRRRFTADYKLKIVQEADRCTEPGQIGALLRREGLYSSQLGSWRHQRQQGQLQALRDDKRGRKATVPHPVQKELDQLRRENHRLRHQVQQAELIIDIQKKASLLLGISLSPLNPDEHD
jgi:transposase